MLSLRYARLLRAPIENFSVACSSSTSTNISNQIVVSEPALLRLKEERNPEKLFYLFQANATNRLVVENRFAFEDTVSRLAGARRFDYIEQILEHQKTLPQGRREGFIIRIIMLYGKAEMPDHAVKTFSDMHLFGCHRTVKSFNATLKVLSLNRRFNEIRLFLDEMPGKFGIFPDSISYNVVIKAFCDMGCLDLAYLFMVEMEKSETKPDVFTYNTLISAFYTSNRREIADGLWNMMVLRRCYPDRTTFNIKIQYLISKRMAWQANTLMHKMVSIGIKPDHVTYNLLIKGFFRMGDTEMAKRIFLSLHGRGCKPTSKIYQTMIHYVSLAEDFDLAFQLCNDSMKRNWYPSLDSICMLIEGLMKNSKTRKAKEILKLVREREPTYSKEQLDAFQSIIRQYQSKK